MHPDDRPLTPAKARGMCLARRREAIAIMRAMRGMFGSYAKIRREEAIYVLWLRRTADMA